MVSTDEGTRLGGRTAWRWMGINALVWVVVALLFSVQSAVRMRPGQGVGFPRLVVTSLVSFTPCVLLTPAVAALALRYRFAAGRTGRSVLAHAAGLVAFVLVAGPMMIAFQVVLPWEREFWRAQGMGVGEVLRRGSLIYVAIDTVIYVLIVATVQAVAYARESRQRTVREAELRAQLAEARLHALSAQLQPHFLFNTLHAISALVREEPQQAERLLARLSELLRHALRGGASADATLAEELAFLEKYVEIQEARYGPRLQVTFDVDAELLDVRVPRLLLQPLVENAIRHGTSRRAAAGCVEVSAHRDGSRLALAVRDDGAGLGDERPVREGIGLSTTRARLHQFYGGDFTFVLASRPDGGAACAIDLPLRRA